MVIRRRSWLVLVALVACDADDSTAARRGSLPVQSTPEISEVPAPLAMAHCTVQVDGIGEISMEEDYLPHVIQCENGGANLEALKAQAIAARSVVYYSIETAGSICDSQGCQVYSCGADPEPIHIQAVQETSGMYLMYNNTLTYGFFVAGDSGVQPPACIGSDGAASTEHWVTYNEGLSGDNVTQTELGFIHSPGDSGYGQNRGCMGQWSARCLENNNGYDYVGILKFFYGDDIGIEQAQGECVTPMGTSGGVDTGAATESGSDTTPITEGGDTLGDLDTGPADTGPMTVSASADGTDDVGETAFDEGGSDDMRALPATYGEHDGAAEGCGCRSERSPTFAVLLPVLVAAARRRRRS